MAYLSASTPIFKLKLSKYFYCIASSPGPQYYFTTDLSKYEKISLYSCSFSSDNPSTAFRKMRINYPFSRHGPPADSTGASPGPAQCSVLWLMLCSSDIHGTNRKWRHQSGIKCQYFFKFSKYFQTQTSLKSLSVRKLLDLCWPDLTCLCLYF